MPNISTFDAGNVAIRPSETGAEAHAMAGRHIGAAYSEAASDISRAGAEIGGSLKEAYDAAVNYQDHQQINAGADHGASLFANLTQSWNQTSATADIHDPTVAAKWRQDNLEPALEEFSKGFTTEKSQDWANSFANRTRQHFFEKTEADMSSMAADAVKVSVSNIGNKFSNVALSDPSAVPGMLDQIDHSVDGIIGANPNIKGPDAARVRTEVTEKLKEQIIKAGAFGAISNGRDPVAAASAWAKQYPDYINGIEEKQLAKAAETQARVNSAYTAQTKLYNTELANAKLKQSTADIWTNNVSKGPTGNVTINPEFFKDVAALPVKNSGATDVLDVARTYLRWGEKMQSGPATETEPQTDASLSDRMFSDQNPTSELDIRKAEADGKLDPKYGDTLLDIIHARDSQSIKNPLFKQQTDMARGLIEGPTATTALAASGKYAAFMHSFLPEYLKRLNAGTLKPDDLDLSKDDSLISQSLAPYRMGLGQIIKSNGGIGAPSASM